MTFVRHIDGNNYSWESTRGSVGTCFAAKRMRKSCSIWGRSKLSEKESASRLTRAKSARGNTTRDIMWSGNGCLGASKRNLGNASL